MAQDYDDLDEGLLQLQQLFGDLGLIVNIMRERIACVDRLREPLKAELEALKSPIDQVVPLL